MVAPTRDTTQNLGCFVTDAVRNIISLSSARLEAKRQMMNERQELTQPGLLKSTAVVRSLPCLLAPKPTNHSLDPLATITLPL